jgi:hypothetical protein
MLSGGGRAGFACALRLHRGRLIVRFIRFPAGVKSYRMPVFFRPSTPIPSSWKNQIWEMDDLLPIEY